LISAPVLQSFANHMNDQGKDMKRIQLTLALGLSLTVLNGCED